jgi:putative membrane protein
MTLFMEVARAHLPPGQQHPLPPRHVTMRAAEAVDLHDDLTEPQKQAATGIAHFGYGTGAGALYGALAPALPFGAILNGVAYGLGVWAGSYLGLLPALRLHPPATEEPPGRNAVMIGAHVVWGAALGLITDALAGGHNGVRPLEDKDGAESGSSPGAPLVLGGA